MDHTCNFQQSDPNTEPKNVESGGEEALPVAAEEGTKEIQPEGCKALWVSIEKLAVGPGLQRTISQINTFGRNTLGFTPYDWQAKTTADIILGHDVACIARAGDGKSAVFQLLACRSETCHIIISPLIGFIDAQVKSA